ncbi:hypothetical protein [Pseudarthrobacter oxydans]|uniref:hypothetical protein n=1 Tax=Pseudarthrobacter oxydans TaxID=1671 RepID=UPI0035EEC60B|nr:hypothetical protein GCM10017547_13680 [Pseudarthrobacter oxydans]
MTIQQHLLWTVLPNGPAPEDGRLRLSVFVAPRLRAQEAQPGQGATLGSFPDFLHWPERITDPGTSFAVELDGGGVVPAAVVGDPPSPELWAAFFDGMTPLTPFEFDDYADRPFISFSVVAVMKEIRRVYTAVAAASPSELPRMLRPPHSEEPDLAGTFEDIRVVARSGLAEARNDADLDRRINALLTDARTEAARRRVGADRSREPLEPLPPAEEGIGKVPREFSRALLFHRRPSNGLPVDMPADAGHFKTAIDFHQMLAALGDHPWLLRRLGLVVDLEVAAADIPVALPAAPGRLRVVPSWQSALPTGQQSSASPWTAYVHGVAGARMVFAAADRTPDPAASLPTGLLDVSGGDYSIQQVDVDGAALKALNLAATLNRVDARTEGDTPLGEAESAGVPALRTGGLALVHAGRARALQGDFADAVAINHAIEAGTDLTLHAQDLVRGYRLDVWAPTADGGTWRSLHRRRVQYTAERFADAVPPVSDEGFFQLSLAGKAVPPNQKPDPNGEVYVHETVVTWDGWSLSAERPGKAISRDPRAPQDDAPETLPAHVSNDAVTAMGLGIECRVQPASLPRLRFDEGYRFRVRTVDLAGNGPTLEAADKILMDPAVPDQATPSGGPASYLRFEPVPAPALVPTERFAEGASMLRLVIRGNAGVNTEEYAAQFNASDEVLARGHSPYRPVEDRHVIPPKAALQTVELHGLMDISIGSDGTDPDAAKLEAMTAAYEVARREKGSLTEISTDPDNPQGYVVCGNDQVELPYLPDPLATGAMFFGLPGVPDDESFAIRFEGPQWYSAAPFRLRLAEGTGAPVWDSGQRLLTVSLPPAATATVRVCSLLESDVANFGIMRWCEQVLPPDNLNRVYQSAKENRFWMITPWHELHLVHAVQQPLQQPEFHELQVQRSVSALTADLLGLLSVDAASTEQIDLVGAWQEPVDDPADDAPVVLSQEGVVFRLPLALAATGTPYSGPGSTFWSLEDGRQLSFATTVRERHIPELPPHAFGDTKHRHIAYRAVATTPFREYFPPGWASRPELLSQASTPVEIDVPSSAAPHPPNLMYVVPTQRWEEHLTPDGGPRRRIRHGGGLRIYLARPWYSSGEGERLGVVYGPDAISILSPEYPFTTIIGQDPVRGGPGLASAKDNTFINAEGIATEVAVPGAPGSFRIAYFTPEFDRETQRWFCDIELATESAYMPLLRLALVRYQPHSVPGMQASSVVLTDLTTVLPDRTLSLRSQPGPPTAMEITVTGPSYTSLRGVGPTQTDAFARARIVATLEQRDLTITNDALGWRPIDGAQVELQGSMDGENTTWSGQLELPAPAGTTRRITIVERDYLAADAETGDDQGVAGRVVYADFAQI